MKPINKTSSSTLVSAGLDNHHINDLKRELSIIQRVKEKIPYTEGDDFVFILDDFLGKYFQGLGIIDFRYKVLDIIHRFERLGLCKKIWVGKPEGLQSLMSFKPVIKQLENYKKMLIDEINHRENAARITKASILLGKYEVDTARKQVVWNGMTKDWDSTYGEEVIPVSLRLCEYIVLKHLSPPVPGETNVDLKGAFSHTFNSDVEFDQKKLYNQFYYMLGKLAEMFRDHSPEPKKVLLWKNKAMCVSVSS